MLYRRCLKGNVRYGIVDDGLQNSHHNVFFPISPRMANIDTVYRVFAFRHKLLFIETSVASIQRGRLQGVEKSMWHRLSFCNRRGNRTIAVRMLCELQKRQYDIQVLYIHWPHWDYDNKPVCRIPNKIKLAQILFKWCSLAYLPCVVPYDFDLKITLQCNTMISTALSVYSKRNCWKSVRCGNFGKRNKITLGSGEKEKKTPTIKSNLMTIKKCI